MASETRKEPGGEEDGREVEVRWRPGEAHIISVSPH